MVRAGSPAANRVEDARTAVAGSVPSPRGAACGLPPVVVEGVACGNGHFNHPRQPFCLRCGQTLVTSRQRRARRPRPPLGTLVRDDGATFVLDRDYLLLDEHSVAERRPAGELIVLESPTFQRVALEVRLRGWDVLAIEHGGEVPVSLEPPSPERGVPLCVPVVGLRRHLRPFRRVCVRLMRADPAWSRWHERPGVALHPEVPVAWTAGWSLRVGERSLLFESPFVGLRAG